MSPSAAPGRTATARRSSPDAIPDVSARRGPFVPLFNEASCSLANLIRERAVRPHARPFSGA